MSFKQTCGVNTDGGMHKQAAGYAATNSLVCHRVRVSLCTTSITRRGERVCMASSSRPLRDDSNADSPEGTPADRIPAEPTSWFGKWKLALEGQTSKLKAWGVAGVASYGLLNTLYYSVAFVTCWLFVANVPKGQGLTSTFEAFLKVFATVWAGSQVTKLPRLAGALMMAPMMDKGLDGMVSRLQLKSKEQAFLIFVSACLCFALGIFGVLVLAWS